MKHIVAPFNERCNLILKYYNSTITDAKLTGRNTSDHPASIPICTDTDDMKDITSSNLSIQNADDVVGTISTMADISGNNVSNAFDNYNSTCSNYTTINIKGEHLSIQDLLQ